VRDLLRDQTQPQLNLRVREHPKEGPYVQGTVFTVVYCVMLFVTNCQLHSLQRRKLLRSCVCLGVLLSVCLSLNSSESSVSYSKLGHFCVKLKLLLNDYGGSVLLTHCNS